MVRVLLVEDSLVAARLVLAYLQKSLPEHEAVHATTLSDGIASLTTELFDIVLLDLNLPDSSGLETFITVRACRTKTPIVILSGDEDEDLALDAVRSGAQDYLVKSRFDHNHLSRSVRFAIERSQRLHFEEEVNAARTIQQKLYPACAPVIPGFDIAGVAFPADQVSGDYFDYLQLADDQLGVVVGDVSGHGTGPALLMAETRAYLHALTYDARQTGSVILDLAQVLSRANNLLSANQSSLFVTLFLLSLDHKSATYSYASAGHRCIHLTHDRSLQIRDSTGPAMGFQSEAAFRVAGPFPIAEGDTLFLGTDGFEEAASETELFGISRVADALWENRADGAEAMLHQAHEQARVFSGNRPQADDMTAVVIARL